MANMVYGVLNVDAPSFFPSKIKESTDQLFEHSLTFLPVQSLCFLHSRQASSCVLLNQMSIPACYELIVLILFVAPGTVGQQESFPSMLSLAQLLASTALYDSVRAEQVSTLNRTLETGLRSYMWMQIEYIGQPSSSDGKNFGNYEKFVFNDKFNRTRAYKVTAKNEMFLNESSGINLFELRQKLHHLELYSLNGTLTPQNYSDWKPFAAQLIQAFRTERAAVAYDGKRQLWVLCGWVHLCDTFVDRSAMIRTCPAMGAVGLDSPSRLPLLEKDYKPRKRRRRAQYTREGKESDWLRPLTHSSIVYDPESSLFVPLFTSTDESCGAFPPSNLQYSLPF